MDVTHTGLAVDELVTVVKNAIQRANISTIDPARDLRVTSVHLKLNAVATGTAGGRLEFRVPFLGMKFSVGGSVTHKDTHIIELTLVPPDLAPQHEIRDAKVETVLVDAIETIRRVVARAAHGEDPFVLKESTVDIAFAITRDGSVSLGLDGEFKDEVTHTAKIGLGVAKQG